MAFPVCSEIVLGEHTIGRRRDCDNQGFCLQPVVRRQVAEIEIHENYDPDNATLGYDIALIRVKAAIPLNTDGGINAIGNPAKPTITPVCLPWNTDDPGSKLVKDDSLTVTGWGKVTNDRRITRKNYKQFNAAARVLQKLEIPAVSRRECKNLPLFKLLKPTLQICAGGQIGN